MPSGKLRKLRVAGLLRMFCVAWTLAACAAAADEAALRLAWSDNLLTISGDRLPGGSVQIWYLEAFCRKGSTHRKWEDTVIPHATRLLEASADKSRIVLQSVVDGKVTVTHTIQTTPDSVTFDLSCVNTSDAAVDVDWAQPCIRVGTFTGLDQDNYISHCFIFTQDGPKMLDKTVRTTEALYQGGQVYVPAGIDREDVNPRPLSPEVPLHNLIGCISADKKWLLAMTWDQTQELFQGIITCIHADQRIGGLAARETKRLHGALYLVPNDFDALLRRRQADFSTR